MMPDPSNIVVITSDSFRSVVSALAAVGVSMVARVEAILCGVRFSSLAVTGMLPSGMVRLRVSDGGACVSGMPRTVIPVDAGAGMGDLGVAI
jgi:hypothetical protein